MSKKNKSTVINNIENLNLEIDYDKLADAIVKAQQKTEEQTAEKNTTKLSFRDKLKLILLAICNKTESNGTVTSNLFSIILSFIFNALAILCLIIMGSVVFVIITSVKDWSWNLDTLSQNIGFIVQSISFVIVTAFIAFILRCVANEIKKEKDRNYVVSVFAAFVAFVALVITVVNTIQGVI